jgi:hypothetical protein
LVGEGVSVALVGTGVRVGDVVAITGGAAAEAVSVGAMVAVVDGDEVGVSVTDEVAAGLAVAVSAGAVDGVAVAVGVFVTVLIGVAVGVAETLAVSVGVIVPVGVGVAVSSGPSATNTLSNHPCHVFNVSKNRTTSTEPLPVNSADTERKTPSLYSCIGVSARTFAGLLQSRTRTNAFVPTALLPSNAILAPK